MAVPFRKVSNTRGRKRRTHYKISENATNIEFGKDINIEELKK